MNRFNFLKNTFMVHNEPKDFVGLASRKMSAPPIRHRYMKCPYLAIVVFTLGLFLHFGRQINPRSSSIKDHGLPYSLWIIDG